MTKYQAYPVVPSPLIRRTYSSKMNSLMEMFEPVVPSPLIRRTHGTPDHKNYWLTTSGLNALERFAHRLLKSLSFSVSSSFSQHLDSLREVHVQRGHHLTTRNLAPEGVMPPPVRIRFDLHKG